MKNFGILLLLSVLIFSCNKVEGEGGTSSIFGTLTVEEYKNDGTFKVSYPGADEDIYIIYGKDNNTFNDKITTSYDGSYRIDNLTTGSYKIYSYSKCKTCDSKTEAIFVNVTIGKSKEVVTAPNLIIEK